MWNSSKWIIFGMADLLQVEKYIINAVATFISRVDPIFKG